MSARKYTRLEERHLVMAGELLDEARTLYERARELVSDDELLKWDLYGKTPDEGGAYLLSTWTAYEAQRRMLCGLGLRYEWDDASKKHAVWGIK